MLTDKELDDIRRKMLDLDEDPPVGGWSKIQADLKPGRRIPPFYWWTLGTILLVGVGIGLSVLIIQEQTSVASESSAVATNIRVNDAAAAAEMPGNERARSLSRTTADVPLPEIGESGNSANPLTKPAASAAAAVQTAEAGNHADKAEITRLLDGAAGDGVVNKTTATQKTKQQLLTHKSDIGPTAASSDNAAAAVINIRPDAVSAVKNESYAVAPAEINAAADNQEAEKVAVVKLPSASSNDTASAVVLNNLVKSTVVPQALEQAKAATPEQVKIVALEVKTVTGEVAGPPATAQTEPAASLIAHEEELKKLQRVPRTATALRDTLPAATAPDSLLQLAHEAGGVVKAVKTRNIWTIGAFFAPKYGYRAFTPSTTDEVLVTELKSNQPAKERIGYEFGASFGKVIGSKFHLETSVAFMHHKEYIAYTFTSGDVQSKERTVTAENQLQIKPVYATQQRKLQTSANYGNLRLGASYYFMQSGYSRFSIMTAAGLNLLLSDNTRQYANGVLIEEAADQEGLLKKTNYHFQLGLGYQLKVYKSYELSVMPVLNYALRSTYREGEPLGVRPYSLGINFQLRRSIAF